MSLTSGVQSFPEPGAKRQITDGRGVQLTNPFLRGGAANRGLRWSRDGRELHHWDGEWLMTMAITPGTSFSSGAATRVLQMSRVTDFDVVSDGRFLVAREPEPERLGKIVVALGGALEIGQTR